MIDQRSSYPFFDGVISCNTRIRIQFRTIFRTVQLHNEQKMTWSNLASKPTLFPPEHVMEVKNLMYEVEYSQRYLAFMKVSGTNTMYHVYVSGYEH